MYISLNSVLEAFLHCRHNTDNKFWGLVAILHAIGEKIVPGVSYTINTKDVSNALEQLFRLQSDKKTYTSSLTWSVLFSNYWIENIPDVMFQHEVNLYDVSTWYFRNRPLQDNVTPDILVKKFLEEMNLSKEDATKLFSFDAKPITFDDKLYRDEDLLKSIEDKTGEISSKDNKTVSFETLFIKSNPGSLGQAPFIQTLYASQGVQKCLIITQFDFNKYYSNKNKEEMKMPYLKSDDPLQVIYYGAPGTGKSYKINDETKSYSTIRTTFHPDSDYSTFVGVYKPTMEEMPVFGAQGVEVTKEKRITYTFVKQAFLKAYLGAWQKYAKGGETVEPQFLVIEEINRGNCAQIFGDLFQLLDRSDNGFSTYPIDADSDLQNEIREAFADGGEYALESELDLDDAVEGYTSNYGKTLSDDIKSGRVLLLPNNLYIWATMNTSDQSLFPIDSAFKRRWDWQYVKITDAGKGWKIKCGDEYCDWWTFIEEINKKIAKETSSDDKKLGYFFCKPSKDSDTITEEKFVGKVLFYLWNDVFKDGDITLFKVNDEPEGEICFDAFYTNDNKVNVEAIRKFLVSVVGEENLMTKDDADDEALEASITGGNVDRSKYTFNGTGKYGKSTLGQKIIDTYLDLHKDSTFDQIKQTFPDSMLNDIPGHGLIVKEGVDLGSYSRYYKSGYTSSDGIKYLIYKQWTIVNIQNIIEFAKKQGWSVDKL